MNHQLRTRHVAVDARVAQLLECAHLLDRGARGLLDQLRIAADHEQRQVAPAAIAWL